MKERPKSGRFEFQNWTVYQKAVLLAQQAHVLCGALSQEGSRSISDQLRKASQSISLNIAEGSARYTKKDKANFLRIARGSVFECAAILDSLKTLKLAPLSSIEPLEEPLAELGRMLSGFVKYIENSKPERS